MYIGLQVKYPLFLSDFNKKLSFLDRFSTIYQISLKSAQWEPSCSIQTDRHTDARIDKQTDMTKLIVAFRNFVNAPKNGYYIDSL
jgi:hypothetical protein